MDLRNKARGSNAKHAKLTEDDVRLIRALSAEGVPGTEIARKFEVTKNAIYQILDYRAWRHVR